MVFSRKMFLRITFLTIKNSHDLLRFKRCIENSTLSDK